MIFQMWNGGAWNKLQFKVCQVVQASVAYLDKHSTLDPVMVSVVNSIPSGRRQLFAKCFKPGDVNSGLKCKCDLIVKNSKALGYRLFHASLEYEFACFILRLSRFNK